MKKLNLQAGFIPMIAVVIIAVLAVGGGAYVVNKNKNAKVELEGNAETQANANADANANENANLGVNANVNAKLNASAKGSLRSLLELGKNTTCTFESTAGEMDSSGTVYISADGSMRGDFKTETSTGGTQDSSMILKGGVAYVWSGNQGAKMNVTNINAAASTQKTMDLDSQVDYECKDWTVDSSKFTLPSGVTFTDVEALLKLKTY